jgi:diacylglycerol kinase (ATP)
MRSPVRFVRDVAISMGHAGRGVVYVVKNERNARVHLFAMLVVLAVAVAARVSAEGFAALLFAIGLVFFAEVINSAIEKTLDLVHPEHDRRVGVIKDMAAAGVLVAALASIAVAVAVFASET